MSQVTIEDKIAALEAELSYAAAKRTQLVQELEQRIKDGNRAFDKWAVAQHRKIQTLKAKLPKPAPAVAPVPAFVPMTADEIQWLEWTIAEGEHYNELRKAAKGKLK